jgi:hypothetical protein
MQSEASDPFQPQPLPLSHSASWLCDAPITIFDPDFPSPEPGCVARSAYSFALPFTNSLGQNIMRLVITTKVLALYSIRTELLPFFHCHLSPIPWPLLSQLLRSCIPFSTSASLVDSIMDSLFLTLDHRNSTWQSMGSVLLQHATCPADPLDRTATYANDPDTCFIIKLLYARAPWDQASLNKVSNAYRPFLCDSRMCILQAFQPLMYNVMVVPDMQSLQPQCQLILNSCK